MRQNPGEDYKKLSKPLNASQQEIAVRKTLHCFFHQVGTGTQEKHIQAFSGSTDLPKLTKDVFNVTQKVNNFDLGWQAAYQGIRLMKGQLEWEIADVEDTSEFELVPEGAKCKIGSVSGSKLIVPIQKYGRGIGVTWEMMEGRKLYKFVRELEMSRSKLYNLWGTIHYGLLATAGATNQVAWVAGTNDLDRDIKTINAGAVQVSNATKDSGYGDTANVPLILYVSPTLRDRIDAALSATRTELVAGGVKQVAPVSWPVNAVYTYSSQVPANKAIMVLPGNKIQNSVYLQELGLSKQDIESLNEIRTYWSAFGAAVGDNDQCSELSFS